jgi:hypothetical protein
LNKYKVKAFWADRRLSELTLTVICGRSSKAVQQHSKTPPGSESFLAVSFCFLITAIALGLRDEKRGTEVASVVLRDGEVSGSIPGRDTGDSGNHAGQASNTGTESSLSRTARGLPRLKAISIGSKFFSLNNLKSS